MTARMRTISGAIREIKAADPNSEFREWALRQLIKSGKIKSVRIGVKYLVDVDAVIEYLRNPIVDEVEPVQYGKLRRVSEQ